MTVSPMIPAVHLEFGGLESCLTFIQFYSFSLIPVSSTLFRETKLHDFSQQPDEIMDSAFGKSFLFLTKLAWNCKVTLPVLVTAVFLAMDFRMQIELNIETEQLVLQVCYNFVFGRYIVVFLERCCSL